MADGTSQERSLERATSHPTDPQTTGPGSAELMEPGFSRRRRRRPSLLERLPWEKALIWGLILLTVYMLRSFFFTIFMVFIVSYIVRSVVMWVQSLISPYKERIWLERVLTLACFAMILFGLYQVGKYIGPRLSLQGKELLARATRLDPRKEFDAILNKTVGFYLLKREYDDETYAEKFEEFRKNDVRVIDFERFEVLRNTVRSTFVADEVEAQATAEIELESSELTEQDYDRWFLDERAPQLVAADRAKWHRRWEGRLTARERKDFENRPNFEELRRRTIVDLIYADWEKANRTGVLGDKEQWEADRLARRIAELSDSDENKQKFEKFFAKCQEQGLIPQLEPYTYEDYVDLVAAHKQGDRAFSVRLGKIKNLTDNIDEADLLARQRDDFEYRAQQELTDQWRKEEGQKILSALEKYQEEILGRVGAWVAKVPGQLIAIPTQLALALLLSLFITLDIAKLRRGLQKLERSRIHNFYQEIAPGVINFGRLIGRAFLAQGAIALCNTVLTFLAVKLLVIQNEYFLCAIVFLCSFIPVLGVVLSSVPIAIMALVQPGGSLWLSLYAIVAILVIHFIETSFFNPKIIGDMLHLHPVLVLAVLAIGEHFFGVWGLLLAVPVSVYIIRFVILNEGIPGFIEPVPRHVTAQLEPVPVVGQAAVAPVSGPLPTGAAAVPNEGVDRDEDETVGVSSDPRLSDEKRPG